MIDENLPTFYIRSSTENAKLDTSVVLSHHGSEAVPAYTLRHPDPTLPTNLNRYAAALYDSFNEDILYGEVLLTPQWQQSQVTKEELRAAGGISPPPQPLMPTEFVVQLYNPDQQVIVRHRPSSWSITPVWEFEMPQQSFRQPSGSALDRTQSDPTASDLTPKLVFKWKREGAFSRSDFVCSLAGKTSTLLDGTGRRRNKEPDITIALFKHLREVTLYESNLSRTEMEDPKGLEVVLLLSAIVIKEVFNAKLEEAFNISETETGLHTLTSGNNHILSSHPNTLQRPHRASKPTPPPTSSLSTRPAMTTSPTMNIPPTDPRTQWQLDVEATRLKKQVEHEARARARSEAAETKRIQKMVEEEDKRNRAKQKEIDRETERLKRLYGMEDQQSAWQTHQQRQQQLVAPTPSQFPPARPHSAAPTHNQSAYTAQNLRPMSYYQPQYQAPPPQPTGPYLAPPGMNYAASTSNVSTQPVMSGALLDTTGSGQNGHSSAAGSSQGRQSRRSSFWSNWTGGANAGHQSGKLTRQRSTVF